MPPSKMMRMVPIWWTIITGLGSALISITATSYIAGQKLAILNELGPALIQVRAHEREIAVVSVKVDRNTQEIAACCTPRRSSRSAPSNESFSR